MLLTVDLEQLDVRPGTLLLDAGCGEGRHCFGALARGARVVGVDLDLEVMRLPARALAADSTRAGRPGGMIQGNTFHLPFRDETFDRVICSEVMEHVHDFRGAARELARVTRPGGKVAVTVPTATSEHLYLRLGDDYFETPGGHIRIFRPRELSQGLALAGLHTRSVGFAHALHTPYWALRSLAGLPRADASRWVRSYRQFLIRATGSAWLTRLENLLNHVFPKSLILYADKPGPEQA